MQIKTALVMSLLYSMIHPSDGQMGGYTLIHLRVRTH